MEKKYAINKKNTISTVFFLILFIPISILMILNPSIFLSRLFSSKEFIFLGGLIGLSYFILLFLTRIVYLINNKDALIITNQGITDNSCFESIGDIPIEYIKDIKKYKSIYGSEIIKIYVDEIFLKNKIRKLNIFKKGLIYMKNWNPKTSVIINTRFIKNLNTEDLISLKKS